MERSVTERDRRAFRRDIGPLVDEIVDAVAICDHPADIEELALGLSSLDHIGALPGELIDEAMACLEKRPGILPLLDAMAAVALPPLSVSARAAATRLAENGAERSGSVALVGALRPVSVWESALQDDVSGLWFQLRAEGRDDARIVGIVVEEEQGGEELRHAIASPPLEDGEAGDVPAPMRLLPLEDALARVADAARRSIAEGRGPTPECLSALPLILRAARVPDGEELLEALRQTPLLEAPEEAADLDGEGLLDEDDEADEAARDENDAIAEEFENHLAASGREVDAYFGGFVAHTMGGFRIDYCDGRPTSWTPESLEGFLLEWAPRKITFQPEDADAFPAMVADHLRFLGTTGRLPRRRAEALARLAERLGDGCLSRCHDPENWGPVKSVFSAMVADGVDPADPEAVDAWIAAFNARPEDERRRRLPVNPPPAGGAERSRQGVKKASRPPGRRNRRARGR
jgi:hypothetical protein